MKRSFWIPAFVLAAFTLTLSSQTPTPAPLPAEQAPPLSPNVSTSYQVGEQGANQRVWQQIVRTTDTRGNLILSTNRAYVELATGLNFMDPVTGTWSASREVIEAHPGGAIAPFGQHKVIFANNLNSAGAIDLQMPDGREMRSTILGLAYCDTVSGRSVLIAETKDCQGQIVGSNQVIYLDAFDGVTANARFRYTLAGLEQDVILLSQPPPAEAFGLSSTSSVLQVWTEFTAAPTPIVRTLSGAAGGSAESPDQALDFGSMQMRMGHAFLAGQNPLMGVRTAKQWVTAGGRNILVESVGVSAIAGQLAQLPASAQAEPKPAIGSVRYVVSAERLLPAPKPAGKIESSAMQLAKADLDQKRGLVLDYSELNSEQGDFTFETGETYFADGDFIIDGTATFQAATTVKFARGSAIIEALGPVPCAVWPTDPYDPAIFTSMDDDSVGERIETSTGHPETRQGGSGNYYIWLGSSYDDVPTAVNARFLYADDAIASFPGCEIWNCQFIKCGIGVLPNADGSVLHFHNALFSQCGSVIDNPYEEGWTLFAENITIDRCDCFSSGGQIALTNSIIANTPADINSTLVGTHNGFYNSTQFGDNPLAFDGNFQSGPFGNYYLSSGSSLINAGNVTAGQAGLYYYTTQTGQTPELNSPVDLGYHYPAVDANGHAVDTDDNSVADFLEDQDGNGLGDWWEIKYFGRTGLDPNSDPDGDGGSLLSDYQSQSDPNVISFSLSVTNNYISSRTVGVQLNVEGGIPFYQAVLINDTNYADVDWQPYTGTNITVTLGVTDGAYSVWVALRGLPTDAQQTWDIDEALFTLDTVPPVIVITNPVNAADCVFTRPYLQLQGFANEQLGGIEYDITNLAGAFTNRMGFVTDQGFDTNLFDFTTNWFQCYDVPLDTNGVNGITLRVSDRAGNTTITNFSVTYSAPLDPPTIQLYWPQNGMKFSGEKFTLRGVLNDETASVVGQIVDASNNTNEVMGLVERGGTFWVENLPLASGANVLTLIATDAAGHASRTNITVLQSDLVLMIDSTPTGDSLYQPVGSVSGRVSDSSYTVWINGIAADIGSTADGDGNYTWSADNVPIYGKGTATFDATAYPPGEAPASSGFSSGENPQSPNSVNSGSTVEMPPHADIVLYNETQTSSHYYDSGSWGMDFWTKDYTAYLEPGANGDWQKTYSGNASETYSGVDDGYSECESDSYTWSNSDPGTKHWSDCDSGSGTRPIVYGDGPVTSVPAWDFSGSSYLGYPIYIEHYFAAVSYHWDLVNGYADLACDAKAFVQLQTGGKAQINRVNLFRIDACATEYYDPPGSWFHVKAKDIDKTTLTVMGLHPGSDGKIWVVLPDNAVQDITVHAPARHYDAWAGPTKHKLMITANGTPLDPDRSVLTNCVGQRINFGTSWDQTPSGLLDNLTTYIWAFSTKFVNHSWQEQDQFGIPYGSVKYDVDMNLFNVANPYAYWVTGGEKDAYVHAFLHFSNGQSARVDASGKFSMYRPKVVMIDAHHHGTPTVVWERPWDTGPSAAIQLGVQARTNNMNYQLQVISTSFAGGAEIIQLCAIDASGLSGSCSGCLDGGGEYTSQTVQAKANPTVDENILELDDAPDANDFLSADQIWLHDSFTDYVMFEPGLNPSSFNPVIESSTEAIYVPIAIVVWSANGEAEYPSTDIFQQGNGNWPQGPSVNDVFPIWTTTR